MRAVLRGTGAALGTGVLAVVLAAASVACAAGRLAGGKPLGRPSGSGRQPGQPSPAKRTVTDPPVLGFSLSPPSGPGRLAPGSDPAALPGPVLIADEGNDRLLLVDPRGRVRWRYPARRGNPRGSALVSPDDAFIAGDGRHIVATQELNDTVSVITIASGRLTRYGHAGQPGSRPGHFSHPDDAMLLPGGDLLLADIMNCRVLVLAPGRWHVLRQFGRPGGCGHHPPASFGSPNGAFPLRDGHLLVTEISGDWVEEMSLRGHVYWSAHPPGVAYPSDANQAGPGRYVVADYSYPGQIVIFDRAGRALWRFRPGGAHPLNHPSLALPLPNGDILVNDDYNDRVIVIDPRTSRIVWQYGHYGVAGRAPGFLNNPDGVDLAPPYSLLITTPAPAGP